MCEKLVSYVSFRIAAAPPFSGLRRFPQGRGFKQWTGDDSKALMKVNTSFFLSAHHIHITCLCLQVYLPAIEGHVPREMLRALRAFLEFCYLARRDIIDTATLESMNDALARFHRYRTIFEDCGVRPDGFCLPRQHSMAHYVSLIRAFGAPNGLCSSITESKHIKSIKRPYRRSNKFDALGQILLINQWLDKLAAAWVDFTKRKMLEGTCLSEYLCREHGECFFTVKYIAQKSQN